MASGSEPGSAPSPGSALPHLVTVSGQDGPGISERLFAGLAERTVAVEDVEQVRVHGHLLLCVEVSVRADEVEDVRDRGGAPAERDAACRCRSSRWSKLIRLETPSCTR